MPDQSSPVSKWERSYHRIWPSHKDPMQSAVGDAPMAFLAGTAQGFSLALGVE
jgi:hypothetical protein